MTAAMSSLNVPDLHTVSAALVRRVAAGLKG